MSSLSNAHKVSGRTRELQRSHDDDELLKGAKDKIAEWQATSSMPSLTQVQELFYEIDLRGRERHGTRQDRGQPSSPPSVMQLGGKRALGSTLEPARQAVCGGVRASRAR